MCSSSILHSIKGLETESPNNKGRRRLIDCSIEYIHMYTICFPPLLLSAVSFLSRVVVRRASYGHQHYQGTQRELSCIYSVNAPHSHGFPIVQWLGYSAFTRKAPVQFRVGKVVTPPSAAIYFAAGFTFFFSSLRDDLQPLLRSASPLWFGGLPCRVG